MLSARRTPVGCRKEAVTQALYAICFTTQEFEMSKFEPQDLAAAELADRYIEIVLSTKPELLVAPMSGTDNLNYVQQAATALTFYRATLIQQLSQQPLAPSELDD